MGEGDKTHGLRRGGITKEHDANNCKEYEETKRTESGFYSGKSVSERTIVARTDESRHNVMELTGRRRAAPLTRGLTSAE